MKIKTFTTKHTKLKLSDGNISFGTISEITYKGDLIPGGEIHLKKGQHIGPNKGFGAEHIWAEHSKEMLKEGFSTIEDVQSYVKQIISSGSAIHCEFERKKTFYRLAIIRSSKGTAILEYKGQYPNGYYSVVTAFSGNKKHGPKIGTVL